jgi:hypothetical protein
MDNSLDTIIGKYLNEWLITDWCLTTKFLLVRNRVNRQLKMAERVCQREEWMRQQHRCHLLLLLSSSSIPMLVATWSKTSTIEVVPYFPPDLEVILENPKSWAKLPQRSPQDYDHPDPDDDYCYHIESVVVKARVKIDGLNRLRFLMRWKG